MVAIYRKSDRAFLIYGDMKSVVKDLGIGMGVVQGSQHLTIDTGDYIIGKATVIKSKRGGKR